MKYVTTVSHGESVPGLHSIVKIMIGEHDDILSISLKADMSTGEFATNSRALVEPLNADNNVILLTGIPSGPPFTNVLAVLDKKGLIPDTLVIAGTNMPLTITTVLIKDSFDDAELLKETLLSEGHASFAEFKIESDDAEDDI